MVDDNAGSAIPDTDSLMEWAEYSDLTHPVCSDASGNQIANFVITGYPTYVIIDRDMTIVNPDLWPFQESVIEELL
jgi:DNA-binding cell septation regulator SpoVG